MHCFSAPSSRRLSPRLAATLLTLLIAGCAAPPGSAPVGQDAAASGEPARPASQGPGANVAGQARTFSTQLATYTAVGFDALPGWARDDFPAGWPAFLESCKVLTVRTPGWQEVCTRARAVDGRSATAIRSFYEREFAAYQIRDDDRRSDGVVTGYFEPEIVGSRRYAPPYIYPVYGPPQDMLMLDARKIPRGATVVAARVDGRDVVIQEGISTRDVGTPGLFALDLANVARDTLDRRVRLRAEGRQLLPYYTRAEIETKGAPNAPVIAFVASATALYEMQIQGSGRIRIAGSSEVIRVGYAEQNGQPFKPVLAQASAGRARTPVKVRGSAIELELDDGDDEVGGTDVTVMRTRGFTLARPASSGAVVVPGRRVSGALPGSGITDPSYVFFKENRSSSEGPVGAFGVPLSAGRSIAVDPRSTPLGYPVFVSTRMPGTGAPMQRLTIAQDTGGAIRGAVRADYFFGNGTRAADQARRMKERGQLWILLPRGLAVASAGPAAIRTRGGAGGGAGLPQCLVPVEGSCVDDVGEPAAR